MEDFVMLHKSIKDDWKFQDEGVLKFWILLLIEETEAVKDKDGLFFIQNISQLAKTAGLERRKATRVLKRMEQDKTVTLLPIHHKQNERKFCIVNGNARTKISIKKEAIHEQNAEALAKASASFNAKADAMCVTDLKMLTEADNMCFQEDKAPRHEPSLMPRQTPRHEPMFPEEPSDTEYFTWIEEFQCENASFDAKVGAMSGRDLKSCKETDDRDYNPAHPPMFPPSPSDNSFCVPKQDIKLPRTKEEEERILRRHALRTALKIEVGYLKDDETVNSFFNQLAKEYNGCPDKETQLAVRANFLRKVYGSFEDTLEIKKAELYSKHRHNPYVLDPTTKKLCEDLLDPEFLELSRREAFQYDEQEMIKFNVRGPRKIGDIAKELVANFSAKGNAKSAVNLKTGIEGTIADSEPGKTPNPTPSSAPNSPQNTILNKPDPSNHVGAELALKSINEVNTILNTNIKNISTSTVQENKLSTVQENIFFKGGYRGEKNQEGFVAENPTENSPTKKNETKTLKVAENHPDGRPVFSSKAFKSLPRAKQIQIIGERLNDFAELFPTVDVEFQFDHWKDWMDAKGQTFKDYSAAFRNWLRKGLDLAAKNNSSSPAKIYTETGAKFVTQEVFTNPAHVPFKKEAPRNPNLKRRPGIGGSE
jgi:hypothetical protein